MAIRILFRSILTTVTTMLSPMTIFSPSFLLSTSIALSDPINGCHSTDPRRQTFLVAGPHYSESHSPCQALFPRITPSRKSTENPDLPATNPGRPLRRDDAQML